MPRSATKLFYYAPALLWGIFIAYYTLIPADKLPGELIDWNDKLLHIGIFFLGALLISAGITRYNFRKALKRAKALTVIFWIAAFGGVIEICQHYWVLNRHGDWWDFAANMFGALLALLFWQLASRRK